MSQVTLNVIASAIATVYVCWAENKQALQGTHPAHFTTLNSAWTKRVQEIGV